MKSGVFCVTHVTFKNISCHFATEFQFACVSVSALRRCQPQSASVSLPLMVTRCSTYTCQTLNFPVSKHRGSFCRVSRCLVKRNAASHRSTGGEGGAAAAAAAAAATAAAARLLLVGAVSCFA